MYIGPRATAGEMLYAGSVVFFAFPVKLACFPASPALLLLTVLTAGTLLRRGAGRYAPLAWSGGSFVFHERTNEPRGVEEDMAEKDSKIDGAKYSGNKVRKGVGVGFCNEKGRKEFPAKAKRHAAAKIVRDFDEAAANLRSD